MKLSILDQSPVQVEQSQAEALRNTVLLAEDAEKSGYHRFWVSEHHNEAFFAGSSPEMLASYLAARTSTIHIGTGGVMLPHYSPYTVAENFRILEALEPGRIDVGIGRAAGGRPASSRAIHYGHSTGGTESYPDKVKDLHHFLYDDLPDDHWLSGVSANPLTASAPEVFHLATSINGAKFAAENGLSFVYAHFITPKDGPDAVRHYRDHFKPDKKQQQPRVIVAVFAAAAETEEEAEKIASVHDLSLLYMANEKKISGFPTFDMARNHQPVGLEDQIIERNRKRMIIGTPDKVALKLKELQETYQADEIMLVSLETDIDQKRKSYRLIAEEIGLSNR
ncbi:LLM class flavin-dependent oxidoreductase [Virgibacillus xinjiangensis]|uniref:LLM class flavin-dependent oxidoreductase n=1 Tax=Virgibacillus xinjiangensis TaxID=393090 RepID=A0ABV7CY49_9BACI